MSLTSSLLIGRSALTASQLAIQVTGDNLANAATPAFHRRAVTFAPAHGDVDSRNIHVGRGVEVAAVRRQVDLAVQSRLRDATSRHEWSLVDEQVLSQIESLVSDLDGQGLSSQLGAFLNTFSELANNPSAAETRASIVEQGVSFSGFIRRLRTDLTGLKDQVDAQLSSNVERADQLLGEIAGLNRSVVESEQGRPEDPALRDRRDVLVDELSALLGVTAFEQPSGTIDVYVGSTPLVIGTQSQGLEVIRRTVGGELRLDVVVSEAQEKITPTSGRIGALLAQRDGAISDTIERLDSFTSALIFEVNRAHSSGRPFPGLTSTTGGLEVASADQSLAFDDPANQTFAGLPFRPINGSFTVHVTDSATGLTQSREIFIDLDGLDNGGAPGTADDTSLASLIAALNAVPNLTAQLAADGRLQISASPGFEFGFENDTSGALAALGINTFFDGQTAEDIAVRQELIDNPLLVVAGLTEGSNETARAIAALRDAPLDSLGGASLDEDWRRTAESVAVSARAASTSASAAGQVKQSLDAQRAAVSGVSVDEESINLLNYQRQYQAAAKFIAAVDELTQLLISLV